MMDASKYRVGYFPVEKKYNKWVEKDHIEKSPVWCSVDMRDGNQSLVIPMSLEEKLEYYKMLLEVGFKEIEVGFPAVSETEYEFLRTLIDNNMLPEDVSVQVLTQCREHIIRKTFDACKGAPSAIIHFYNSVSVAQREQVFKKSKEEIKQIAIDGAKLVKKLAGEYEGNFRFEYSPESFTGTEPEYALEVCNAVLDILEPGPDNNVIINLPVTVEMSMPHVYASQVEYMSENLKYREYVTISLHPHNDRGTGVADAELALLAGADRVEGTLFGNGERTGNVDIITLAMNMYSHGVDPKLDFSSMHRLAEEYPDVELSDMLVDNCAMQIVKNPAQFDVVVTENMFGDILSDEASMITGSIGMIPSSSLGATTCGLYEPIHGSAPDIAGQDIANPVGTILSVAMMLRYSFDMAAEADAIEKAVSDYLDAGYRTADIMIEGQKQVGCKECGEIITGLIGK